MSTLPALPRASTRAGQLCADQVSLPVLLGGGEQVHAATTYTSSYAFPPSGSSLLQLPGLLLAALIRVYLSRSGDTSTQGHVASVAVILERGYDAIIPGNARPRVKDQITKDFFRQNHFQFYYVYNTHPFGAVLGVLPDTPIPKNGTGEQKNTPIYIRMVYAIKNLGN